MFHFDSFTIFLLGCRESRQGKTRRVTVQERFKKDAEINKTPKRYYVQDNILSSDSLCGFTERENNQPRWTHFPSQSVLALNDVFKLFSSRILNVMTMIDSPT